METKEVLLRLREANHLTQEEMASKLYVFPADCSLLEKWRNSAEHGNLEADFPNL